MSLHHSTILSGPGLKSAAVPARGKVGRAPRPMWLAIAELVGFEYVTVASTTYLAGVVYHGLLLKELPSSHLYVAAAVFVATAFELMALSSGHYRNCQSQSWHGFLFGGFGSIAIAFSFLLSALFIFKLTGIYSRATFVFQFITVEVAILITRSILHARMRAAVAAGLVNARQVVLIGESAMRAEFSGRLEETAIQTVGSFAFPEHCEHAAGDLSQSSETSEIRTVLEECRRLKPDDILILTKQDDIARASALSRALSEVPVALHVVPVESAAFLVSATTVELGNVVTMRVMRRPLSRLQLCGKRMFDFALGCMGLMMLMPLLAIVALAIKLDSRGPVLFRQTRHGYNNETIRVFKFRSMVQAEEGGKFLQAVRNDSRVTRVGAFLRRTNIDELPQLINVLRGEMSIVGPRPHATAHNHMFEGKIPAFSRRHVVKPGMTGWAQVNGCRGPTPTVEKMQQRVDYDLYYVDNWSFVLDLRIILMTVFSKSAYENAY